MSDNSDRPPVPEGTERREALAQGLPSIESEPNGAQGFSAVPDPGPAGGDSDGKGDGEPKAPREKGAHLGVKAACAGLLGGVVATGAVVGALYLSGAVSFGLTSTTDTTNQQITINASDTDATVAQAVAKKALPSVVSIYITTQSGSGVGSGVILDTDGNILTNYHVISDAQSISVTIDGKSYEGSVVGSDSSSDLAVVKVDPGDATLTPIEVGDSSSLVVGDWVMAIGSPYGLDQSVSTGIVSSLYRSTMLNSYSGSTIYANLIQTDAAINPGNSGGALVDDEGKLVGINSIIESESGSSSGIGFAIDGNYAVKIAKTIISGETVTHPYLGVSLATVNSENSRRSNLSVSQGAYVSEVTDDSPASTAGIKQGDVITKVDDTDIASADALMLAIRSYDVGDKVKITLVRGSDEKTVEVTLGSDENLQKSQSSSNTRQGSSDGGSEVPGDSGNSDLDLSDLLGGN